MCLETGLDPSWKFWTRRKYVLECDACECDEDGLRSEVGGAEVRRGESQELEGEAFCFDH